MTYGHVGFAGVVNRAKICALVTVNQCHAVEALHSVGVNLPWSET